ncbi:LA_3781 family PerA/PerB upregulated protein [Leptospira adleri]|uniref:LA_3781 family PerA/PerB upregulated protein n=1 Tax=Leptospira adleri TaxID=2023186 RepID=UPI00108423B8|nr:hypothetical protein [Leptospira adleri]TGM53177.1 hypothetical protein EHQ97_14870 [Leptospira adleri]
MNVFKKIFTVSFFLFVLGCHNTTLQIYPNQIPIANPTQEKPEATFTQGGYLVGMIENFKTPEIRCREGKPQILIQRNLMDSFLHWTIGGIYTRRTVQVFCNK